MTQPLTVRLFEERDLPGILRLWKAETEWGAITAEQWRSWNIETPHGEALVVVTVDNGCEIAEEQEDMSLNYRLAQRTDFAELQKLWAEETTWGGLTERMWQRHVEESPHGEASGTIATDSETGKIVGQFAFVPSLITINGREYRAFRPYAPIITKTLRFRSPNPLSYPIVGMYLYAAKALRERGDGIIYMVPDPRWVRFFRLFPNLEGGFFPLWRLDLPLATPFTLPEGYTVTKLKALDDPRLDQLWGQWSKQFNCAVVRNSRTLPWKIGGSAYVVLAIEKQGELAGFVASQQKGDRQWLVCDLMAANTGSALDATLKAVSNLAHQKALEAGPENPIKKVVLLVPPAMEQAVRALGFVRDKYDFPMIVHILDPSIKKENVAPLKWYVSAND